jgi:hypothetical protein
LRRVASALAPVEPDRGRTASDELEVDVQAAPADVAEKAPVGVDSIEARVGLEDDRGPFGEKLAELSTRGTGEALSGARPRGVDLRRRTRTAGEVDGVAVDDAGDGRACRSSVGGLTSGGVGDLLIASRDRALRRRLRERITASSPPIPCLLPSRSEQGAARRGVEIEPRVAKR